MAPPEPPEAWVTIAEVLGVAFAAGFFGWLKSYFKGRAEESEPRSDIPARAVGAAFLDRSAADAIAGMSGDVRKIRELAEDADEREREDRRQADARRIAREELERAERRHGKQLD